MTAKRMSEKDVLAGLRYIASSPPRERGGFHPNAVATAKAALRLIARLRRDAKAANEKGR